MTDLENQEKTTIKSIYISWIEKITLLLNSITNDEKVTHIDNNNIYRDPMDDEIMLNYEKSRIERMKNKTKKYTYDIV